MHTILIKRVLLFILIFTGTIRFIILVAGIYHYLLKIYKPGHIFYIPERDDTISIAPVAADSSPTDSAPTDSSDHQLRHSLMTFKIIAIVLAGVYNAFYSFSDKTTFCFQK